MSDKDFPDKLFDEDSLPLGEDILFPSEADEAGAEKSGDGDDILFPEVPPLPSEDEDILFPSEADGTGAEKSGDAEGLFASEPEKSRDDDDLSLSDDMSPASSESSRDRWKVLVVDDEEDVHTVTNVALFGFAFKGKELRLLKAHSAEQAKEILRQHPDMALILLDVVMETTAAGLEFVRFVREDLSNRLIRIILRTGQPGEAPEREVISHYEIDDYKTKTELTSEKLFTTVTTSLRTYDAMMTIESYRRGFENKVAERTRELEIQKEELRKSKEIAETAHLAKSDFMANMSHELRTPMNAIIGMGSLLKESELTRKQKEYVNIILRSSDSLMSLINDILDFSEMDAGRLTSEESRFDLRQLLEEVADKFGDRIMQKGLELVLDIPADVPFSLIGDSSKLFRILGYLLDNAFKFTDEGEICLSLATLDEAGAADRHEVLLCFRITDTGVGIPRDKLGILFEPFTQADGSSTRRYGGAGLGLTICRELVRMMGGRDILIRSEPGKGSEFSFIARFRIGDMSSPSFPRLLPDAVRGQEVLVVSDSDMARANIMGMLGQFGLRAEGTKTAEDALKRLPREPGRFGLVLMDWKLPGMDGLTASGEILKDDLLRDVPVIMMTPYAPRGREVSKAEEMGVCGLLYKPLRRAALFDMIMACFGYDAVPDPKRAMLLTEKEPEKIPLLLSEGNHLNRLMISEILAKAGFRAEASEDMGQALTILKKKDYAAVLMDVRISGERDLEAVRRIRESGFGKDIPIIGMFDKSTRDQLERFLDAGMTDSVGKPINYSELLSTLKKQVPPGRRKAEKNKKASGAVPDKEAFLSALGQLEEHLRGTSYLESLECMQDIRKCLPDDSTDRQIERIEAYIKKFEFDKATRVLSEMRRDFPD